MAMNQTGVVAEITSAFAGTTYPGDESIVVSLPGDRERENLRGTLKGRTWQRSLQRGAAAVLGWRRFPDRYRCSILLAGNDDFDDNEVH